MGHLLIACDCTVVESISMRTVQLAFDTAANRTV